MIGNVTIYLNKFAFVFTSTPPFTVFLPRPIIANIVQSISKKRASLVGWWRIQFIGRARELPGTALWWGDQAIYIWNIVEGGWKLDRERSPEIQNCPKNRLPELARSRKRLEQKYLKHRRELNAMSLQQAASLVGGQPIHIFNKSSLIGNKMDRCSLNHL